MILLQIDDEFVFLILQIRENLHDRTLPLEKRLEIEVAGGFKAQVSMKLPPDYNPAKIKAYPMLVYV